MSRAGSDKRDTGDSITADSSNSCAEHVLDRQKQLLSAVNGVAAVLLSVTDEEKFEVSLREGMEIMARCVDVDRINIWRNETREGTLYYVQQYEWMNETGRRSNPLSATRVFPYSLYNSEWESKFLDDECVNGPLTDLSRNEQKLLEQYGIKSILVLPVHLQKSLWGFVSFDDCRRERVFTDEEIDILRSASLMMVSAVNRNAHTAKIKEAHERVKLMLDATPLACSLWNSNISIFDCNEETVKLFKLRNKKDFLDHFFDFSPEYQPDGQPSKEAVFAYARKVFEDGRCVFEWVHQALDGTLLPTEVTLVRVSYESEYIIAAYMRDMRGYRRMMQAVEHKNHLLNTVNGVADILLRAEVDEFKDALWRCMGMMAEKVDADRVSIWENRTIKDKLCCTQIYEWSEGAGLRQGNRFTVDIPYSENVPGWEKTLSDGHCINSLVRDLSPEEQAQLSPQGIMSILVVPVFLHNRFWGFVGFDDCRRERIFSEDEESVLRSAGLLIAHALLRNDMTRNVRTAAAKLEAVITNYLGIIISVDQNGIITLFNGLHVDKLGKDSSSLEGKPLDAVFHENEYSEVVSKIRKTFTDGTQEWISEINGAVLHMRTIPIVDDNRCVVKVVCNIDDITDIVGLQYELESALRKAQSANRAKSNFLARMSHEMRTPLNAIIGLSELAVANDDLNMETLSNIEKTYNAGMTLLSTVNDLLDISKIDEGRLEIVPDKYHIASIINDAISQSLWHIGEKPVEFILDIDENLPVYLYGDDLKVKQIINNLLSNAFKYTEKGTVELSLCCEREGDAVWMTIRVRDTGIGIKPEVLSRLFFDYDQIDMETNRVFMGTGLGLAITKKIADLMNGSVTAESEYGKGSVFTARIRQKFVSDATFDAKTVMDLRNFRYSFRSRFRRGTELQPASASLSDVRVLVVDDIAVNLDVAKGMLKPYGLQIDCVMSGQQAVDAIREEKVRYDAIFMDHMMPGMDGIKAVKIIREEIGTEYAKTIPVIALTANAILGNEKEFLRNGFQAFLRKPIEIARLDSVVRKWLKDVKIEESLTDLQAGADGQDGKDSDAFFDRRSGEERRQAPDEKTACLDIERGIERFGGDRESFMQILRSFEASTRSLLAVVKGVTSDNLANYAITVHGIKGSSRSVCADVTGDMAEVLEKAAKAGDFEFVSTHNQDFIKTVEELLAYIDDTLGKTASKTSKPRKDKPDRGTLTELLNACKEYDMDGVDAAMAEIESFEYESGDGLTVWLRENVEQMNFVQIDEKLSALIGTVEG